MIMLILDYPLNFTFNLVYLVYYSENIEYKQENSCLLHILHIESVQTFKILF